MNKFVLDASAVLAFLNAEIGATRVGEVLENGEAAISSVNLSEVVAKLVERGMTPEAVTDAVHSLGMEIVSFDEEQAFHCGYLRLATKQFGLSLGDRACLALASRMKLPALTAEQIWMRFDLGIKIELIRNAAH